MQIESQGTMDNSVKEFVVLLSPMKHKFSCGLKLEWLFQN